MYSIDHELRFYSFVNFYLSAIQQGIQTGHCAVDLVMKYLCNGNPFNREITQEKIDMVRRWADGHKTIIIALNGGEAYDTNELLRIVSGVGDFPFACLKESDRSLKDLLTCVGVVLPETIFNAKPVMRADGVLTFVWQQVDEETREVKDTLVYEPGHPYYELVKMVKSRLLAR